MASQGRYPWCTRVFEAASKRNEIKESPKFFTPQKESVTPTSNVIHTTLDFTA